MGICNSVKKQIDIQNYPQLFEDSSSTEYINNEVHNDLDKDIDIRDSLTKSKIGWGAKTDLHRVSDTSSLRHLYKHEERFPYIPTSAKTTVTSHVDRYKVISLDSSSQSKTEEISLASIDCDTDSDETFSILTGDTHEEYGSVGRDFFQSFDGLNKRVTNRYEIGLEVLKALIKNGANPHAMSTIGDKTALMFAVLAQDFAFVKNLVERGVDVGHMNCHGETALGLAIETQRNDIADYLRANGSSFKSEAEIVRV